VQNNKFMYKLYIMFAVTVRLGMGIGSGGLWPWPPWVFIHSTDIVDRGLIVLFFGLFCYFCSLLPPSRLKIFLPTPLSMGLVIFLNVGNEYDVENF